MIYVDDARRYHRVGRHAARWSHLFASPADDVQLKRFGRSIGLRDGYFQKPGDPFAHFDVTDYMRERAIQNGAVPVTTREAIELLRKNRTQLSD